MDDSFFEVEASTPLLPEDQQTSDLPRFDLKSEAPRPPSRRKRVTQISLVLVALVVVVVTFHDLILPSRPAPSAPPPQATLPPPSTLISSNLTFGTVSINGHQQRGTLPMLYLADSNRPLLVTLDAPPFHPVSCTMLFTREGPQGPISNSQDCALGPDGPPTITVNGHTTTPASWMEIDVTAADLPPDQQRQINTLLPHAIAEQQSTTVPAGSYFATRFNADSTITSQRAATPLQATASLVASTIFGQQIGFSCTGLICKMSLDPQQASTITGRLWLVGVPVALRWRFTTSAGQVVGDASFPVVDTLPTLLAYTSNAGWSLSAQSFSGPLGGATPLGDLDCTTGAQVLMQHLQTPNVGVGTPASQGIEGCTLTVQGRNNTTLGSFLWRFGVLLAADDAAHTLLPTLPLAPPAEISAVQG